MQVYEDLRERYFGPTFELQSHDKVSERPLFTLGVVFFKNMLLSWCFFNF